MLGHPTRFGEDVGGQRREQIIEPRPEKQLRNRVPSDEKCPPVLMIGRTICPYLRDVGDHPDSPA